MSTVLHPVGPQRARVYWLRRLVVVLAVVALGLVATTAVSWWRGAVQQPAAAAAGTSPGGGADGAGPAADEGEGPAEDDAADAAGQAAEDDGEAAEDDGEAAEDDGDAVPAPPVECRPEALRLTLAVSAVEVAPGTDPVLTATVANVGEVPCTVDAGHASREVVITSGEDRIWSTKDCAKEATASRQLLLGAGAADTTEIEWPRKRSAEGCPAGLPAPRPGTYQAVATLGAATSQSVVFVLG